MPIFLLMKFIEMFFKKKDIGLGKWDYSNWNLQGRNIYFFGSSEDDYSLEKISFELGNLVKENKLSHIYKEGSFGKIPFDLVKHDSLKRMLFDFREKISFYGVDDLHSLENQRQFFDFYNRLNSFEHYPGKEADLSESSQAVNSFLKSRSEYAINLVSREMEKNNLYSSGLIFDKNGEKFISKALNKKNIGFAKYFPDY